MEEVLVLNHVSVDLAKLLLRERCAGFQILVRPSMVFLRRLLENLDESLEPFALRFERAEGQNVRLVFLTRGESFRVERVLSHQEVRVAP